MGGVMLTWLMVDDENYWLIDEGQQSECQEYITCLP